jgi:hypothetical protein
MARRAFCSIAATASVLICWCAEPADAQDPQTGPRTPMSPGSTVDRTLMVPDQPETGPRVPMSPGSAVSDKILMAPADRDGFIRDHSASFSYGMAPKPMAPPPYIWGAAQPQSPDLLPKDTEAINSLADGKADVVVSSRADTELVLQLFRPDQNQWQEYRLAPLSNTLISCPQCTGKLKFSFNDGVAQSNIDLKAPSFLRIYRDGNGIFEL